MKNPIFSTTILAFILISNFSCKKPTFRDSLNDIVWKGYIHQKDEENPRILSEIIFRVSSDTAYIYSNAIFGADNDTLKISEFTDKDSIMTLESDNVKWKLKAYLVKEKPNDIVVVGDDFYLYLKKTNVLQKPDLSFYLNKTVSPYAFMYLEGTYEGEIEMENQMQNLLMSQISPMGIKMKVKFLDEANVKIYTSALLGNDVKTRKYYIKNESIFIDNGNKYVEYEVKNNGNTIVFQDDKINVVLRKKY